jgi:cytochrome c oxidase subunit 2
MTGAPGEQVFLQNTCVNCHTIRGLPATGTVGPDLTHFGSRSTLGAGVLDNTRDNLVRWIRNPQEVKPGVLMPAFSSLSDADVNALADYLESLR